MKEQHETLAHLRSLSQERSTLVSKMRSLRERGELGSLAQLTSAYNAIESQFQESGNLQALRSLAMDYYREFFGIRKTLSEQTLTSDERQALTQELSGIQTKPKTDSLLRFALYQFQQEKSDVSVEEAVTSEVTTEQERERLKGCSGVVFHDRRTALEMYINAIQNPKQVSAVDVGKELAQIKTKSTKTGEIVPLRGPSESIYALMRAVERIEERVAKPRIGFREQWEPIDPQERRIWEGIREATAYESGTLRRGRSAERSFKAKLWDFYHNHQGDIIAGFRVAREAAGIPVTTRRKTDSAVLPTKTEEVKPTFAFSDAFWLVNALMKRQGVDIIFSDDSLNRTFALDSEVLAACDQVRKIQQQHAIAFSQRPSDQQILEGRKVAVGKLQNILEGDINGITNVFFDIPSLKPELNDELTVALWTILSNLHHRYAGLAKHFASFLLAPEAGSSYTIFRGHISDFAKAKATWKAPRDMEAIITQEHNEI